MLIKFTNFSGEALILEKENIKLKSTKINKNNQWISICDKLPLESGYYLVWYESKYKETEIGIKILYFHSKESPNHIKGFIYSNSYVCVNKYVKYWMNLPDKPCYF